MRIAGLGLFAIAVIALAVVLWPRPLFQPSTPQEKAIESMMMSDLNGLGKAERFYFRSKGSFTDNADSTIFLRTPGVGVPSITLKGEGWYATVTHAGLPGVTCAIAVAAKNPLHRAAEEGVPVCK